VSKGELAAYAGGTNDLNQLAQSCSFIHADCLQRKEEEYNHAGKFKSQKIKRSSTGGELGLDQCTQTPNSIQPIHHGISPKKAFQFNHFESRSSNILIKKLVNDSTSWTVEMYTRWVEFVDTTTEKATLG
jgi:hypothetical protein